MPAPGRGLGRMYSRDDHDQKYLLMQHPTASQIVKVAPSKVWTFNHTPLDQGHTGTCVGHGWKHSLMAMPLTRKAEEPPSAFDIYDAAIKVDQWPENDNDTARQMGTSVRAGAQVLQTLGLLKEYSWCYSADDIIRWLAGQDAKGKFVGGPVVIGIPWYQGMFETDANGFLNISGALVGGHCLCLNELHADGVIEGIQNWALPWGLNGKGHFLIRPETLDVLVKQDGEACASTESRKKLAA